jgi:protein SCO1/2
LKGNFVSKRGLVLILSFLLTAILVVLVYIAFLLLPNNTPEADITQMNPITVIEPPQPMPDFTLTNQNGEAISLSSLSGKPVLLTFGFTHCPDVCPITLGEMRAINRSLDNRSDDIHYVFITVDGGRDTPEVLTNYFTTLRLEDFMIGMTGTESEIRDMGIPYGLDFAYGEVDALGNYAVEHTAGMFLLDSEGQWIRRYTYGMPSQDIVSDIREVLQ